MDEILKSIMDHKPRLVGFSCLTGPSLSKAAALSRKIKPHSSIPVVWGGAHPSMLPEQTLMNDYVDLVVVGEGEETMVELAGLMIPGKAEFDGLDQVKGIAHKKNGTIQVNPQRPYIMNLDDYRPAWDYLDRERYIYGNKYFYSEGGSNLPGNRIAGIISSRGCPWRCGYCFYKLVHKKSFRAHSADRVIRDIQKLKNELNITAVNFEDANFFTDRERALKIIRNIDIPWGSSLRANNIAEWGDDFIRELKKNQCVELQIGAESGSQRILDLMQKDITVDHIRRSAEICNRYDIRMLFSFMIGIPGETRSERLETFQLMDDLRKLGENVVVNGPFTYFPFPGTPLYKLAVDHGFRAPRRTEDWNFTLWGIHQPLAPYADREVALVEHYRRLAWRKKMDSIQFPFLAKVLKYLAIKRWEKRFFRFTLDYHLPRFFLNILRVLGLRRLSKSLYH
jgi:radical SAM superfamily enzyme YgiQ (UPF0313 family)